MRYLASLAATSSLAAALVALAAAPAAADEPTPPPAPPPAAMPPSPPMPPPMPPAPVAPPAADKMLGVGYKLGDGIGLFGADVIVAPAPHVAFDLYGTVLSLTATSSSGATTSGGGYAIAPAVQYHVFAGGRSTPYLALGVQYVHLTLGSAVGSASGTFFNVGYEWKWQNGLGIELGGGVQYLSRATATDGTETVTLGGNVAPNLEAGVRYMFF